MELLVILGWLFTTLLFVLVIASVAASRGAIRANHWFGIRLPALMRSETAWRAGHSAAIVPASIAFIVSAVASLVGLLAPLVAVGSILAFIGGVIWVLARASKAAQTVSISG